MLEKMQKPNIVILDDVCEKHGIQLQQLDRKVRILGESEDRKPSPFCPECLREQREEKELAGVKRNKEAGLYAKTYDVLMRDSTIPDELKEATFDNYTAKTQEEKELLDFFKQQAKRYWNGANGNALVTGSTGIGKSHLSVAMAKLLNEQFKKNGKPKSFLFVNLTEIIKRIKEGWNYGNNASLTEYEAVRMLTEADYLILDDLGARNAEIKPKSDWEQDLLFDVLDKRENTIINTNLTSAELRMVYNARNFSRLSKGLNGNAFKAGNIKDKRAML